MKAKHNPCDILTTAINTTSFLITKPFSAPVNSLWTPQDSFYEASLDYSWENMYFQTRYVFQAVAFSPFPPPDWEPLKVRGPYAPALSGPLVRSSDDADIQQTIVVLVRKSRGILPSSF